MSKSNSIDSGMAKLASREWRRLGFGTAVLSSARAVDRPDVTDLSTKTLASFRTVELNEECRIFGSDSEEPGLADACVDIAEGIGP